MASRVQWRSGDCKPVLATHLSTVDLVKNLNVEVFREKDDLDWFSGAIFLNDTIGQILIMQHDNNPQKLTAVYVDDSVDLLMAEAIIVKALQLPEKAIFWRRRLVE